MKKFSIFLIILGFSLMFPINNARADIWARGVSEASGWFDAEKQTPYDGRNIPDTGANDDDDLLCWAASAADILMWSGWDAGYADEDDVFEFFIDEDPVDAGGWQSWAWNFWFDGTQTTFSYYDPYPDVYTATHFENSSHTGFYSTAEFTANYYEDMTGGSDVLDDISALLQADWGVGIAVRGSMDHAVTVWGLETDAAGDYTGIWLTDSDNNISGPSRRLNPHTLDYYTVTLSGGLWYLDDFYGTEADYIREIQALQFVPVPAAVLLGILGLGVAGLKLRKFA